MANVTLSAPAKLNLRLKVTGRRTDGYHLLSMLNVNLSLCDSVSVDIIEGQGVRCRIEGNDLLERTLREKDNLAVKAALRFLEVTGWQRAVEIVLQKRIPTGAGLAGGSADAAAVLRALTHIARSEGLSITDDDLINVAATIGADVPYCVQGGFCWVKGIGDLITELPENPLKGQPCLLITSQMHSSTPAVFARFKETAPRFQNPDPESDQEMEKLLRVPASLTYEKVLHLIENDLETAACDLLPELSELSSRLRAVRHVVSAMTGSGSAFFCISKNPDRMAAEQQLLEAASSIANADFSPTLMYFI